MFQGPVAWLKGRSECRQFTDGSTEQSGWFCWFWLAVMILSFSSRMISFAKAGHSIKAPRREKLTFYLVALAYLLLGAFNIWIFNAYAENCKCLHGFFITIVTSAIGMTLIWTLSPEWVNNELQLGDTEYDP